MGESKTIKFAVEKKEPEHKWQKRKETTIALVAI